MIKKYKIFINKKKIIQPIKLMVTDGDLHLNIKRFSYGLTDSAQTYNQNELISPYLT